MATSPPGPSTSLELANQAQSARLRASLLAGLAAAWRNLGSWHTRDVTRFTTLALPLIRGAQLQMTALTAAYLSRQIAALTGDPVRPLLAPTHLAGTALRGVPMTEEYTRPFRTVWTELGAGADLETALDRGGQRLANLAATDLQLAKTHASRALLARDDRVTGYRRVLEGAQSCGLCIVASTQRYHRGELLPIHPACDCSVAPILGTADPGHIIDAHRLADVHDAIASRFGAAAAADARRTGAIPDYRDLIVVHTHGEIGPVLTVRGHAFTGPHDLR